MIIELILPSIIITSLVAISAGLLSCFVVWRRMAFFADALSHSAILGTAIAMLLQVNLLAGLIAYGILVAVALAKLNNKLSLSSDTLLAILSQTSLALGLLTLSFAQQSLSLEALLFGDILAVSEADIIPTTLICLGITSVAIYWRTPLIRLCIDEELAQAEGLNVSAWRMLLMLMLVALIATAIQLLGVLLVSTLLLIPAASARSFAKSPSQMLLLAPLFALAACMLGLGLSLRFEQLMTGPSIVVCAAALWLCSLAHKNKF